MNFMTEQEIFNHVLDHIVEQGQPARDSEESCMYLTASGLKCAVGCLIKPQYYNPIFEGETVSVAFVISPEKCELLAALKLSGVDAENKSVNNLLSKIQTAHDTSSYHNFVEEFKESMRDIAEESGLEME